MKISALFNQQGQIRYFFKTIQSGQLSYKLNLSGHYPRVNQYRTDLDQTQPLKNQIRYKIKDRVEISHQARESLKIKGKYTDDQIRVDIREKYYVKYKEKFIPPEETDGKYMPGPIILLYGYYWCKEHQRGEALTESHQPGEQPSNSSHVDQQV